MALLSFAAGIPPAATILFSKGEEISLPVCSRIAIFETCPVEFPKDYFRKIKKHLLHDPFFRSITNTF